MLDHVRNKKKNILLFVISTLSILIVTTSYFFMNSQISSEFYQIPFFQENVSSFDIFRCRLDTASKQTHKGADAPKVIHEC